MTVKQISVFLENKHGRLAEVTKILGDGGVNLRAMTIADTADFGICRIICDDDATALKLLEENGFTARETDVLGLEVPDKPGGLARIMAIFNENDVNIEYLYGTLERSQENAIVIFKVEDITHGIKIIEEHGLKAIATF
jgi:hypothetical protein